MPDGIRLGGAFYELTADSAGLVRALSQAEQASKKSAQAISQQTGVAEKDVQRLASSWIAAEKRRADASAQSALRIIKAHNDAAAAIDKAAAQQARSTQQANAAFLTITRTVAGFAVAAAGVTVGAATINAAMTKIAESTQKAAQAQFALNALYGQSAPIITKQAEDLAKASGRSRTEALEAATAVATLGRSYALTFEQQRKVLEISANLAAVRGIPLEEATKRVSDAIRGEAEAAEYLGQVLNSDAVKAFANMTAEQRKNFESLDPLTKAQIVFGKLVGDNADLMGKAAERANSAAGANDKLTAAVDNLATTIGQRLAPAFVPALNTLAAFVEKADEFARGDFLKRLEQTYNILAAMATLNPAQIAAALTAAQAAFLPPFQVGPDPGAPGGTNFGPTSPATTAAIAEEARRQEQRIAADRKNRARSALEAADKANDATAESAIKAIDKERKEKERWYDEERQRIEARRTYQLEDIEARRDAAIAALEEEKRAAKEALEAQIEDQERLKDARLAAAEEASDRAKAAIDAEKDRLDAVREIEDRARSDERELTDRALEDARRNEDRAREQTQKDEIRGLEDLRDERVALIEDEIEAQKDASEQRLRALDREGDRARANADKALARLERQGEKEDEQHRKRMQALDDEQDARLGILDAQLKALDAQEKSADAAERIAGIQQRLNEAQREAAEARGTGTPAQITAARGDLTRAIRSGDPIAEANAREQLVKLAGKGNEAIREADEKLADAQADLRKEGVDGALVAERDKLKAAQDAIRADIEARKRAEDDEARRRKQSLERDQENERAKLKARLDRLEGQKQATRDNAEDETRALRETLEAEKRTANERIQASRDRFDAEGAILQDRRREEDRFRDDQRQAQDRFRADERTEQDKALATQLAAVNATLEQERRDTEAHFNGPNGTITQLRKAIEDSELLYSRRLAAARISFEEERKAAERVYTNPEGNGLLQLLEKARQSEFDKLEASKEQWRQWQKDVSQAIKDALADLDAFIARGASSGGANVTRPDEPRAGGAPSGQATSSSAATSRSGRSGKDVKGTLGTWINDAMDITGVSDDWARGLFDLVQKESGGDPHNIGYKDVIDASGHNFGRAKGLLQMIQDTFSANRDRNLPNDIFDPVANAVSAINYIKRKYGHVDNALKTHAARGGYDAGGMIREPVIGRGLRSGAPYAFAERGPEYLIGRKATAMLGRGPQSNYAGLGAFMAQAHSGGGSRSSVVNEGDVIFQGLTYAEAEARQKSRQHKARLLRRVP